MKMHKPINNILTTLLLAGVATTLSPLAWAQPVEIRVHDPVMIKQDDTYYLFCTGRGVSSYSSPNLTDWERGGAVFDEAPAWIAETMPPRRDRRGGDDRRGGRNLSLWAPDIAFHNGAYYLYYSVSSFGSNNSAIGVATNTTLDPEDAAYEWVHHGPVVQSMAGRDMWNAIDPNLAFDDDGTPDFGEPVPDARGE